MTSTIRVLHFVTGGFTGGATQVAVKLTRAAAHGGDIEALLVLRRKRHTDMSRFMELQREGLRVRLVPGWSHFATIVALWKICREYRPDILVAHGFSEHLWGRYAGLLAGVPNLVHVEHNTRERYTRWRLAQARWLSKRTARLVGCSEGVRQSLLELGFPAERTIAIDNGIELSPFAAAERQDFAQRESGLIMVARFGQQKDHATLIRALEELRRRGLSPTLELVGGGKERHRRKAVRLTEELRLADQVRFHGVVRDVPERLLRTRIAVLSSRHEGMPLALIEGMAAGCAVIGTRVPGIREIIDHGINGLLAEPDDPNSLADSIERALRDEEFAASLGATARRETVARFGVERMSADYERLFRELTNGADSRPESG